MSGLERSDKPNLIQYNELGDTPVWGNHCDAVPGLYASSKQTICEVLNSLGPIVYSVQFARSQQEDETYHTA
jgi:hypothetical protein